MNDGKGTSSLLTAPLKRAGSLLPPSFAAALLLASFLCPREGFPQTEEVPPDKRQQIERLEEDLSRQKEQYEKFGEKERTALEQLSDLEKDIEEKRGIIKDLRDKLPKAKKNLKDREARLKQVENSVREVEDRLGRRLDAFYRYARRGYVRTLATSEGLDDLRRRITYLQSIMGEDCVLLRFPLETGQAWSTCHGLLIEVAGEESITLPTGRRFSVALRVDILEVAPSADASGMDTLLVESHHYAPGVGRVLTTNYDRETRAVSGRSALFEASIE